MRTASRRPAGDRGSAVMASIVTARLEPSGLPRASGYTTGFAVMAAVLVVAALAGLLIPSQRRPGGTAREGAAADTLAMIGDAVTGEPVSGETVASELGE